MDENNNDKSRITSSNTIIEKRKEVHCNDFKCHLIIFTLLYTFFYFYKYSQLSKTRWLV